MLSHSDNELICRTGRDTAGGRLMRHYWLPFALASELPGPDCDPLEVRLLGEDLVAFRDSAGRPGLLAALCPHRRAPLFHGRNEQGGLRCVYHGWKFDVDGRCLDLPNDPDYAIASGRIRQLAYPVVEHGRVLWTWLGDATIHSPPPFPDFGFTDVPDSHVAVIKVYQEQNWLQGLEGVIDPSHVPFLHGAANAEAHAAAVAALRSERIAQNYWATTGWDYLVDVTDHRVVMGTWRKSDETSNFWRVNVFLLPCYAMGPVRTGPAPVANLHARVPVDDHNHLVYSITWHPERPLTAEEISFNEEVYGVNLGYEAERPGQPGSGWLTKANRANRYQLDRRLQRERSFTGIPVIAAQDQAVTEGMGVLVDRSGEHLVKADLGIVTTRRLFLKAAKELRDAGTLPGGLTDGSGYRVRAISKLLPATATDWPENLRDFFTYHRDRNPPQP